MPVDPKKLGIFHITDVANLPRIVEDGRLISDARVHAAALENQVIGYDHIKERRRTQIRVSCCGGRFVGEFVPFYFCPRSPMLYTINRGNTGRAEGSQQTIVHLVSSVAVGVDSGRDWAFSFGNAGTLVATFSNQIKQLDELDWDIINSNTWGGEDRRYKKQAEFLIADEFPFEGMLAIGCYNNQVCEQVKEIVSGLDNPPKVVVRRDWYY